MPRAKSPFGMQALAGDECSGECDHHVTVSPWRSASNTGVVLGRVWYNGVCVFCSFEKNVVLLREVAGTSDAERQP